MMQKKTFSLLSKARIIIGICILLAGIGCKKQPKPQITQPTSGQQSKTVTSSEPITGIEQEPVQSEKKPEEPKEKPLTQVIVAKQTPSPHKRDLDFEVENHAGKTIFVTCFSYLRRQILTRWRWAKSPIYEIKDDGTAIIDIGRIEDSDDRKNVFGYLGIFNSLKGAENATFELTTNQKLLDLDLLYQLKGKKVVIEVERYGFKDPFLEYDFVDITKSPKKVPALDFYVINRTSKTIFVTCFTYEKKAKGTWIAALDDKDDMSTWRFDKTKVLKVEDGTTAFIKVDTIQSEHDRPAVIGYLAVFDEDEEKLANTSTFELLEPRRKIHLGLLNRIKNKTVMLEIEKYGAADEIIEYTVKPVRKIDFKTIVK